MRAGISERQLLSFFYGRNEIRQAGTETAHSPVQLEPICFCYLFSDFTGLV